MSCPRNHCVPSVDSNGTDGRHATSPSKLSGRCHPLSIVDISTSSQPVGSGGTCDRPQFRQAQSRSPLVARDLRQQQPRVCVGQPEVDARLIARRHPLTRSIHLSGGKRTRNDQDDAAARQRNGEGRPRLGLLQKGVPSRPRVRQAHAQRIGNDLRIAIDVGQVGGPELDLVEVRRPVVDQRCDVRLGRRVFPGWGLRELLGVPVQLHECQPALTGEAAWDRRSAKPNTDTGPVFDSSSPTTAVASRGPSPRRPVAPR